MMGAVDEMGRLMRERAYAWLKKWGHLTANAEAVADLARMFTEEQERGADASALELSALRAQHVELTRWHASILARLHGRAAPKAAQDPLLQEVASLQAHVVELESALLTKSGVDAVPVPDDVLSGYTLTWNPESGDYTGGVCARCAHHFADGEPRQPARIAGAPGLICLVCSSEMLAIYAAGPPFPNLYVRQPSRP